MRENKERMMNLCNWVTCGTFTNVGKSPTSIVGIWFGWWWGGWDQEYSFEHVKADICMPQKYLAIGYINLEPSGDVRSGDIILRVVIKKYRRIRLAKFRK